MSQRAVDATVEIEILAISERDIDLLLMEEAVSSPAFCHWLLEHVGKQGPWNLISARHSSLNDNGESDIELEFERGDQRLLLLIEDKIDALLQPDQDGRYLERAARYRDSILQRDAVAIIVAPENYDTTSTSFQAHITYEAIRSWFTASGELASRRQYKLALLDRALNRAKDGWVAKGDKAAKDFREAYYEYACGRSAELRMSAPPVIVPLESHFVTFRPNLPKGVSLVHKIEYGHVDLQLAGAAARYAEIRARVGRYLAEGMEIHAAGKSVVVRIMVPKVELWPSFEQAKPQMELALAAAERLLSWYQETGRKTLDVGLVA